jgi:hypothetical protein
MQKQKYSYIQSNKKTSGKILNRPTLGHTPDVYFILLDTAKIIKIFISQIVELKNQKN